MNTDRIWKFQSYSLIYEYDKCHDDFPLPPPFNLFIYLINFIVYLVSSTIEKPNEIKLLDYDDIKIIGKKLLFFLLFFLFSLICFFLNRKRTKVFGYVFKIRNIT